MNPCYQPSQGNVNICRSRSPDPLFTALSYDLRFDIRLEVWGGFVVFLVFFLFALSVP